MLSRLRAGCKGLKQPDSNIATALLCCLDLLPRWEAIVAPMDALARRQEPGRSLSGPDAGHPPQAAGGQEHPSKAVSLGELANGFANNSCGRRRTWLDKPPPHHPFEQAYPTTADGSGRPESCYGSGGQKHAGGSVCGLPRTRRRSVHDSRNLSRAPLASLRDRLRRPLTEPVCRQVRQLSGSGEGPGTGQGAAGSPETGREMATRTRTSRCRQPGATLSHGKPPRGSGRARPWRRPGRSQDRHQHSSEQQAVTGGSAPT
jgi:hypothetical protein